MVAASTKAKEAAKEAQDDDADARSEFIKKREQRRLLRQQEQHTISEEDALLASLGADTTTPSSIRNVDKRKDDEKKESHQNENDDGNDDDDNVMMIPLAKRRRLLEEKKLLLESMMKDDKRKQKVLQSLGVVDVAVNNNKSSSSSSSSAMAAVRFADDETAPGGRIDRGEEGGTDHHDHPPTDDHQSNLDTTNNNNNVEQQQQSLLEKAAALQQSRTEKERKEDKRKEEEERILRESSKVQTNALMAASELASGVTYTNPMPSSWTVPRYILQQGEVLWTKIRKEWHMEVEGSNIPPPMKRFQDMKFPTPILKALAAKGIKKPTPIQMQGLPVALASRDMVGIAFTGSGKTMTFSLPMVMAALEEELRMPLVAGEGPVSIVMAPSRELARQTYDVVQDFCTTISNTPHYPSLRAQLFIGGESARDQLQTIQQQGCHCIVATPGRLRDILKRKAMTLDICRFICLDEADRMLDLGFDEEVGEIMNYFQHQRQTLLFSATFPQKFQQFAKQTLVQPIVVNVGRAGAANLDVIQEVEYVKQEAKIVYLLHCLQKTSPPVVIFCERKGDVDDIHEYLLLKGVEAVSIHGGKDQEERNEAIALYKAGEKDVLGTFCWFFSWILIF